MLLHRDIALDEVGHRRRGNAQQLFRRGVDQFLRRHDRRRVLAHEHRAVDHEVMVVGAIERIDVHRPFARQILAVDGHRLLIIDDDVAIVAAQHIDMGRHMDQVAGLGHQLAQPVARPKRPLRERRHLHQMDVEMQQAGMIPRRGLGLEQALEQLLRLLRPGLLGNATAREVPHLPRRLVHDRFGQHAADVEIIAEAGVDLAHLLGEGLVPGRLVLDRIALGIAGRQGADQRLLDRRVAIDQGERRLHRVVGGGQSLGLAGRIVEMPRQVVVRARRIGDAPLRHRAGRVVLQRLAEAFDRLGVVEAEDPVQAAVEPDLRLGRFGGDRAGIGTEIVVVHVSSP